MRYILALSVMVLLGPSAAVAQEAPCPLYRVNTSLLPVSTNPGGPANKGGLFDGDTLCVQRQQTVGGSTWGFVAYKVDQAKVRTPVEGWSTLSLLQGLSADEAQALGGVAPPPPAVTASSPPPASPPVAPPSQAGEAERAWGLVKDTTDVRTLEAFRQQFGAANPLFDRLAESRIEELKKRQVVVASPSPATAAPPDVSSDACKEDKENVDPVILACTELVRMQPRNVNAYLNRAWAYNEKREYDRAIADAGKVIEIEPREQYAYNARSFAYRSKGDPDRAIVDATKAIELDAKFAIAYYNRGGALHDKKLYDRAIVDFTKAIEFDPMLGAAYNDRGSARSDKKQYDLAIADFTKAIEIEPGDPSAYYNRGNARIDKFQYDLAIADFTKSIEIDPKYADAYTNRGFVYEKKGDRHRAIADYRMALQINPGQKIARQNLANMGVKP